jgi:uncharacterized protein YoxC
VKAEDRALTVAVLVLAVAVVIVTLGVLATCHGVSQAIPQEPR